VSKKRRQAKNSHIRNDLSKETVRITCRDRLRNETAKKGLWLSLYRIVEQRLTRFGHVSRMGSEWFPAKVLHFLSAEEENKEHNRKNGWTM